MGLEEVCLRPAHQVLWEFSEDSGHHRQMFQVVMSLEQRVALEWNMFIRYCLVAMPQQEIVKPYLG